MKPWRRFLIRLAASVTRRRDEDRLREELEQHAALQTAEHIRAGMSPAEARRQALIKLGGAEAITDHYRDEQGLPILDNLVQDVRYTLRQLRKAPLFTLTATVSLAIGIGANAAVFAVIERVLLRPLPVDNPEQLVFVTDQRILTEESPRFSYPFYAGLRDNGVLAGVAARASVSVSTTSNGQLARAAGELVSGNYFSVIGADVQMGRTFTSEDDRTPGAHAVAIISDGFWRRNFGSDPSVLEGDLQVNNHSYTIIGVAARGFSGTDVGSPTDIWLPMMMQARVGRNFLTDARTNWLEMIGRLTSDRSAESAGAELTALLQRRAPDLMSVFPDKRITLVPGGKGSSGVRRELGPALRLLLALTVLALVLACVNVASLLAVRSAAREKEVAVRLALGAARSRLTRQFLTETLVLTVLGGAAGLLIAPWATRLIIASQPHPLGIDASLDIRLFLFGLVVSVLTGLFVGQAPILASRKVGLTQAFASASWSRLSSRLTVHDLIVTFQIAMSLTMLISAALLVQSLRSLNSVDPGFRADDVLLISLDPRAAGYDSSRMRGFWRDTLERVSLVPGVASVSLAGTVPLAPGRQRQPWFDETSGREIEIDTNFIGPRYFRTLDIPLLSGREFDERDQQTSRPVVIINERMAKLFWPEQDPIGKSVRLAGANTLAEVVGLVKDVKYRDLRGEMGPMIYRPMLQTGSSDAMTLHVRAASDPGILAGAIRRELQIFDRNVPAYAISTLEDRLNASFAQTRQAAMLTGVFGLLALVLSGIGVYGVTALVVTRRTRDIGIRIALGAGRGDIIRAIGQRGFLLVMAGIGLGLLGSYGFTRFAASLLYGVTARDSASFAGMSALLIVVAVIGFCIPARRATRLDAVAAIRYD